WFTSSLHCPRIRDARGRCPKALSGLFLDGRRRSVVCSPPMSSRTTVATGIAAMVLSAAVAEAQGAGNHPPTLLSDLVDVSRDFRDYANAYYLADALSSFDPATGNG